MVVRGTARAPAQNRPELCVGQAESKPGQGERRAPPLCGHGNRPARGGCAGRGALAPNLAETAPSAHTLPLLYNKRAAGASKRRNSQAKPTAPEPPGRTVLPNPPPPALEKNLPAPLDNATTPCGVEQMVARRAHNPEVAGSSPVPATTKRALKRKVSALFSFCLHVKPAFCPWAVRYGSKRFGDIDRPLGQAISGTTR